MGKIIKAGVEHYFSGGIGSGSDIVILTQEEYDELVTNNTVESGVYYFIEDVNIEGGNNVVNDASDIIYDNSTSGLEADNIQGAIDEVSGNVFELNQNMQKVKTYVGTDGKLHFVDASGADTALNFSAGKFIGVGAVNSLKSNDGSSVYSGCAIDTDIISKCKYLIYQTEGECGERYLYTSKGVVTPTSLGNNTYEYICADGETFSNSGDFYGANTIMFRQTAIQKVVRFTMCKFLESKPTT